VVMDVCKRKRTKGRRGRRRLDETKASRVVDV
jgi:hypothetical protein